MGHAVPACNLCVNWIPRVISYVNEPEGEDSLVVVDINEISVSRETRVPAGGLHKIWIEAMI
jgi:hypothetical protein